jgi:hypothetical protein
MKEGLSKQTIWGIVLMFGFTATHFLVLAGYPIYMFFILWGFLLFISMYVTAHEVMKKWPQEVNSTWQTMTVLGILLTLLFLTNLIKVDYSLIMSMWLAVMGLSMFATGMRMNWPESIATGGLWLFFALIVPQYFTNYYFLLAGFVFVIPLIFIGHLSK